MAIIQHLGWRQDEELKASFGYVIEMKLAWAVRNFVEQIKEANSKGGHAVADSAYFVVLLSSTLSIP